TAWAKIEAHKMVGSRNNFGWGLDQTANNLLWNMYGTPASATHWFNLRVIKQVAEAPTTANGQYSGDFYGLLLAVEDYDKNFLNGHNLEKGNVYKLKSFQTDGISVRQYLAPNAVTDA